MAAPTISTFPPHSQLRLSNGNFVILDPDWFQMLASIPWQGGTRNAGVYALTKAKIADRLRTEYMHRVIMGALCGQIIDHINGNTLDNRRANLRFCTSAQNSQNMRRPCRNSSGYKGVTFHQPTQTWVARIRTNPSQRKNLGYFATPEQAANAYNEAAKLYHGEFARLNIIPSSLTLP